MKLAYCFKGNDLPIFIVCSKAEICSKAYHFGELMSFVGNLGSFPWPEDFCNEMDKRNIIFDTIQSFICI